MKPKTREYSKGDLTVVWKAHLCEHAAKCVNGLPSVFDPEKQPWIDVSKASKKELMKVIDSCPSGALSYYKNGDLVGGAEQLEETTEITVFSNGPLHLKGKVRIKTQDGNVLLEAGKVSLCRCGASGNKPFCDGSHHKIKFEG